MLVTFLGWEKPITYQFHIKKLLNFAYSYSVYPVAAYPTFNIGHIIEYKVLLLKVIFLGSECTRIDLKAFKFQNFPSGGMPLGPPRLVWFHSIVSAPYLKIYS